MSPTVRQYYCPFSFSLPHQVKNGIQKVKNLKNSYPCFAHLHSTTSGHSASRLICTYNQGFRSGTFYPADPDPSGHSVSRLYVHITRASDPEPFTQQIRIHPGTVCHNYMYI